MNDWKNKVKEQPILNYVQKSGCNGFTDGEIYGHLIKCSS